jgi:hypothetical protein
MTVAPSEPLPSESTGTSNLNLWLTIGLGALGVLLIGGGIFWYWRSSQRETAPRRRSRGRAGSRAIEVQPDAGDAVYCQQCGRRAASGDRFCRTCGTRLRLE